MATRRPWPGRSCWIWLAIYQDSIRYNKMHQNSLQTIHRQSTRFDSWISSQSRVCEWSELPAKVNFISAYCPTNVPYPETFGSGETRHRIRIIRSTVNIVKWALARGAWKLQPKESTLGLTLQRGRVLKNAIGKWLQSCQRQPCLIAQEDCYAAI